ncbi:hypothetical protein B0T21DRAFT_348340 [Apiosordaria backusii]|uniref:Integral membrane protein n=1 Tax=Apiosordaria backusii TaxID=314023 RepID=A0AA40BL58_9PEZI|nr:hypothetical protein B0T21DRAFT_348340 [Apiosordaria backusii]
MGSSTRTGRIPSILTLVLLAISLALLLITPLYSLAGTNNPNSLSALQFVTIDASATSTVVNGDEEIIGLPDLYDGDRAKQIYKVYLLNYCSGVLKPGTIDQYVFDFCSGDREEIWDLFGVWQAWGVNLKKGQSQGEKGEQSQDQQPEFAWLEHGPEWLWIGYIVAISLVGLSFLGSLTRLHRARKGWVRNLVVVVAVMAAVSSLGLAIGVQVMYGWLVSAADDDQISITAKQGIWVYVINWIAAAAALVALITRLIFMKQTHKEAMEQYTRRSNGRRISSGNYGMPAGKYVEVKDPEAISHALISEQVDTRYEPFRGAHAPPQH